MLVAVGGFLIYIFITYKKSNGKSLYSVCQDSVYCFIDLSVWFIKYWRCHRTIARNYFEKPKFLFHHIAIIDLPAMCGDYYFINRTHLSKEKVPISCCAVVMIIF